MDSAAAGVGSTQRASIRAQDLGLAETAEQVENLSVGLNKEDVNITDNRGWNALHFAIEKGKGNTILAEQETHWQDQQGDQVGHHENKP